MSANIFDKIKRALQDERIYNHMRNQEEEQRKKEREDGIHRIDELIEDIETWRERKKSHGK